MFEQILNKFRKPDDKILIRIDITADGIEKKMIYPEREIDPYLLLQVEMLIEGLDYAVQGLRQCMTENDVEAVLSKIQRHEIEDDGSPIPVINFTNKIMRSNMEPNNIYR